MKHDLPADLESDANAAAGAQPDAAQPATEAPGTNGAPSASAFTPPPAGAQTRDEHGGAPHGFFAWLRGLGISRQPGWIGGVAAGIAARIGIDPIIVRGVLVVLALLAPPALLFYGVAWLLLPDTDGHIQAQRLARGEPQPALAGIAIFVLFGLFSPHASLFNSLPFGGIFAWGYDNIGWSGSSIITAFVNLFILAALTAFIVWLVLRSNKNSRGGGAESAWPTDAAGTTVASGSDGGGAWSGDSGAAAHHGPAASSAAAAAAATAGPVGPVTADGEPLAPSGGATTDEMAAWKLQHEAWRIERERFNRAQADADRDARVQWVAENKARSQAFAAQALEHRRLRKLERPRVSASAVFFTLGVALVAGAGSAIAAISNTSIADYAATVGVLVAALVASVAMIVAGIARRRSGFLAFVAMFLLLIGVCTAVMPRDGQFLFPGQDLASDSAQRFYVQPWGALAIWVMEDNDNFSSGQLREMTVTKANGGITIHMLKNTTLELSATLAPGNTITGRVEGSDGEMEKLSIVATTGRNTVRVGDVEPGEPADLTLNAELGNGSIRIVQYVD